jgi:hypothetical protein
MLDWLLWAYPALAALASGMAGYVYGRHDGLTDRESADEGALLAAVVVLMLTIVRLVLP